MRTRQRQGRDFRLHSILTVGAKDEQNGNEAAERRESAVKKASVIRQLNQFREEAERDISPVDGHEPPGMEI